MKTVYSDLFDEQSCLYFQEQMGKVIIKAVHGLLKAIIDVAMND